MSTPPRSRRLAAILFADIVGYSQLSARDETAALELVETLHSVSRACADRAGGRVIKFIGDAAMAEFPSTEAAVRCAIELQNEFVSGARGVGTPAQLRIGVHVGDVSTAPDGDLHGDGVNIAARIQSAAEPGQVLVSEDVWRQLRSRRELDFVAEGERELKGISLRVGVFSAGPAGSRAGMVGSPLEPVVAAPVVAIAATPAPPPPPPPPAPRRSRGLALAGAALLLAAVLAAIYLSLGRDEAPRPAPVLAAADSVAPDSAARPDSAVADSAVADATEASASPTTRTATASSDTPLTRPRVAPRRPVVRAITQDPRVRRRIGERRRRP